MNLFVQNPKRPLLLVLLLGRGQTEFLLGGRLGHEFAHVVDHGHMVG